MLLEVSLPADKASRWVSMIDEILKLGTVTRDQLESLIGRLSFPQTSIFGRFGRPMLSPLYGLLNSPSFRPLLSTRATRALQWWKVALSPLDSSVARHRSDHPDFVVFTDAATSSAIIDAVIIDRATFVASQTINEVRTAVAGKYWELLFDQTCLIYGLEMLAILAILYEAGGQLAGKNATFHIDNQNALQAIIKNNATPTVIVAMTQLILHRLCSLKITPWFEWVPSTKNIADVPTRHVAISFNIATQSQFTKLRPLREEINRARQALETGIPVLVPNMI